jgi:AmpD protein
VVICIVSTLEADGQLSAMKVRADHWLERVRRRPSPNAEPRPDPADVSLLVIHNISLPPGEFGTGCVEALFTNTLDTGADARLADLEGVRVSAHVLIERRGRVTQFVPFDHAAWHAGVSCCRGRRRCNDFSIGIELEGTDTGRYTRSQYRRLLDVTRALLAAYPRLSPELIVGHQEIAPGRKTDPGASFDWPAYLGALCRDE